MNSQAKNHLSTEKSPYLLQHADNPVHWFPWGEEAFIKAKKENKPVLLSIGYSTCHWCHVMAHESFENPETAKVMNDYFVSIKVDREERPDIDNIYMSAVMAMTGSGGWPLTVFLTPDQKPFFGGTYFPPESRWGSLGFKELLISIHDAWTNKKDQVAQSSESILKALEERLTFQDTAKTPLEKAVLTQASNEFIRSFDARYGGFGEAPKFPMGHSLSFLLRYWKRSGDAQPLEMVQKTLAAMAGGGLYDHLGGGFHRYSTDRFWQVPHFEKMLYDQAILSRAYLEGYQATGDESYARIIREVFEYVLRDMQAHQGGFFSAEDADSLPPDEKTQESSKKKEGAFYLWSQKEIFAQLNAEEAEVLSYHFGVEPNGNAVSDPHGEFTGKNILYVEHDLERTSDHFNRPLAEIQKILLEAKKKLFLIREKRPRPHLDDKILVDWNGLMISSLAFGSRVLNEPIYREAAEEAAQFILQNMVTEQGRLLHRYRDGEAGILGTIEDYAFFIHGLLDLYEATFKVQYLKEAQRFTEEMVRLFWDGQNGGFFFTASDSEELIIRQKEVYDGAIPSGNSVAALDLIRLYHLTLKEEWLLKAEALFKSFSNEIRQRPNAYAQMNIAFDFYMGPSKEIVISGDAENPQTQEMIQRIYQSFLPNKVVILRPAAASDLQEIVQWIPFIKEQKPLEGQPTAYVCENHMCLLPTTDLEKFQQLLDPLPVP